MVEHVLQSDKATLRELKEYYSLEDMYNIYKVYCNQKYNEWQAIESSRAVKK